MNISKIIIPFLFIAIHANASNLDTYCPSKLSHHEELSLLSEVIINTYIAASKDPTDNKGIWDQSYIKSNPSLEKALIEFKQGKRGLMAKQLRLTGKDLDEIHYLLLSLGFKHKRIPLGYSKKSRTYWLKNGSTTNDSKHPEVIPMDIYVHDDGSMLRVKPFGIPDSTCNAPRRMAHISKSVLKDLNCHQCEEGFKHNTNYANEAFKVTEDGYAVPKSPSPHSGLKLPYDNSTSLGRKLNQSVVTTIANLSHTNLPTSCPLSKIANDNYINQNN